MFAGDGGCSLITLFLIIVPVTSVLRGRDPQTRLTALEGLVLTRKIDGLASVLAAVATALGEGTRAGGDLGGNGRVLLDPVCERVLAVLDDATSMSVYASIKLRKNLRLGGLVAVVCLAGLTRGYRGVINELKEVLSVACNDGKLLAVLTHGIELVGESSLQLLTGDVGQLGLGDKGLSLSTDKLLFKDDNLGRVGLLVLQLSDLVGDLLLACGLLVMNV